MKQKLIILNTFLFIFLFFLTSAYAVPNLISYQGILNDSTGTPMSGTVSMTFTIYDSTTGGSALWNESQSVQVTNGIFNIKLGAVQQLSSPIFSADSLFLGIRVGSDTEMVPRQQITTGSFVYRAAKSDTAAQVEQVIVPVGAIIAWVNSITGVPALPDGWIECNGQAINDVESPMNGQTVPDLDGRFLRGNSSPGGTGGSTSHSHSATSTTGDFATSHAGTYRTPSTENHLPPYYNVVWIMKIK